MKKDFESNNIFYQVINKSTEKKGKKITNKKKESIKISDSVSRVNIKFWSFCTILIIRYKSWTNSNFWWKQILITVVWIFLDVWSSPWKLIWLVINTMKWNVYEIYKSISFWYKHWDGSKCNIEIVYYDINKKSKRKHRNKLIIFIAIMYSLWLWDGLMVELCAFEVNIFQVKQKLNSFLASGPSQLLNFVIIYWPSEDIHDAS